MGKSAYKLFFVLSVPLLGAAGYFYQIDTAPPQFVTLETYTLPLAQHGLQAHIDPDTGRFSRPSPSQLASTAQRHALQQSSRVRKIRLQDGTLMLDLQQHYRPVNEGR